MPKTLLKKSTKKILISDDDLAIADAIKLMLELSGYEVSTTHGRRTLDDFYKFKPDLLMLDIWMAGKDGISICKELKADVHTKDVPIVMVSASKDVQGAAGECGADGYLAKPFEMDLLLHTVEKFIK